MTKYSEEFKEKVVRAYLNGEGGYARVAKEYGMPSIGPLQRWVAAYQKYGLEGIVKSQGKKKYTFEFKLSVVKLYMTQKISYQELALQVGMKQPSCIVKWVREYRTAGPDALKPKGKGGRGTVKKRKNKVSSVVEEKPIDGEYLKQLEAENRKLKIEVAYLKELRRLRLEGSPLNKKRESSTASEETSN